MAFGHDCGRDARAPRVAWQLQKMSNLQIPAKAGIQKLVEACWIPAFAGMTVERSCERHEIGRSQFSIRHGKIPDL